MDFNRGTSLKANETIFKVEVGMINTTISAKLHEAYSKTSLQMDGEWLSLTTKGLKGDKKTPFTRVFKATQFHWHHRSEHLDNTNTFDLELQVECEETAESKAANKDEKIKKYVFVLLFDERGKELGDESFDKLYETADYTNVGKMISINMEKDMY